MNNHPYLKSGGTSLLLHGIFVALLVLLGGSPGYVAPVEEPETVEVEVEPARLLYAPPLVSEPETASPQPAASGSPAPSSQPPAPNQPPAPDPAPARQWPQPEIPNPLPVLPNADPASNEPPSLAEGTDENSVALPALVGDNGGLGTPGPGTGAYGSGTADGSNGGSGYGNGGGTGSGHGHGDGSGEGYSGPSGFYQPKPTYPPAARQAGKEGSVLVRIEINEDGIPAAVTVVSSSGDADLDAAAVTGVRRWRYSPARRDGQPIASSKDVRVRFRLDDE